MKIIFYISILAFFFSCSNKNIYYIDAENGNDSNNGNTPKSAWASFQNVNQVELKPGSKILLASGSEFNESLILKNVSGSIQNPIEISAYNLESNGKLPLIDARGFSNGILLENCNHIQVSYIEITGDGQGVKQDKKARTHMHCGVLVTSSEPGKYDNIQLKELLVRDVFFEEKGFQRGKDEVRTANGSQNYGWGIRVINQVEDAEIANVVIENCTIKNVAHTGIKFTGRNRSISEVQLLNNKVTESGGPGMQMSGVKNALVKGNEIQSSGSNNDSRKWGRGSGFWCWGSCDIIIENNSFINANGPGDSAGCHIDFNCENVVVQYNLSEGNAGGFCEILGNNYNCSYRYNISINDGHRVKGKNRAFQEGKIFWLSGYAGNGKPRTGPFNSYFYNNTIYVSKDIEAKIAVDRASSGVLIANNIFYIEGGSKAVKGDQYKPETEGESRVENIVFKNNLYLKENNWPKEVLIQDSKPVFGNPNYKNPGGFNPENYIPQNIGLIKNKGIEIEKIPGDDTGLTIGLKVEKDFFGNPVIGLPDMGAVELK